MPPTPRPFLLLLLTQLLVLAGVILPAREQSNAEFVKNGLRLRYFKSQPVQMELMTDGDEVLADMDEILDKMRLKVRVDEQVRPGSHPFARQILLTC